MSYINSKIDDHMKSNINQFITMGFFEKARRSNQGLILGITT